MASALAGTEEELSLPAVESKLQSLQARQVELLQLVMAGGVGCTDYDEELQRVTTAKSELLAKKLSWSVRDALPGNLTDEWRKSGAF